MTTYRRKRLSADEYIEGVISGNRTILSQAITLIESKLPEDEPLAEEVLEAILPHTGKSIRVGITGVPGVGKSTFIERFGLHVIDSGQSLAVLAIDPSSQRSKGSILGDKTRMEQLSRHPKAYVRPSASGSSLGGVAHKTRESALLCEAAGFTWILVETVGVGQSETAVHDMVDFFLLLMLAGAGDELQGIKKGIMEMADMIAITKSDQGNEKAAKQAAQEYRNALHLFPLNENLWQPKVSTCSALSGVGMDEILHTIVTFKAHTEDNGFFQKRRREQNLSWFKSGVVMRMERFIQTNKSSQDLMHRLEEKVKSNQISALRATRLLFDELMKNIS